MPLCSLGKRLTEKGPSVRQGRAGQGSGAAEQTRRRALQPARGPRPWLLKGLVKDLALPSGLFRGQLEMRITRCSGRFGTSWSSGKHSPGSTGQGQGSVRQWLGGTRSPAPLPVKPHYGCWWGAGGEKCSVRIVLVWDWSL